MKFIAYIPRHGYNHGGVMGDKPLGTSDVTLFELKTIPGAHKRARSVLGPKYKLFRYTNFYDDKTFRQV